MSDKKKQQQALADAAEQATEYGGFARSAKIVARRSGEEFEVRSPLLFDDDQLIAYQRLHHLINQCDRWPDTQVPEQRIVSKRENGEEVETYIGAHTRRGEFIEPYQKDGELIDPPYEIQVAQIVLGDDYERFRAGGGSSRELVQLLAEMRIAAENRVAGDSKSADGDDLLEADAASGRQ